VRPERLFTDFARHIVPRQERRLTLARGLFAQRFHCDRQLQVANERLTLHRELLEIAALFW
jgi:hypothetical protein